MKTVQEMNSEEYIEYLKARFHKMLQEKVFCKEVFGRSQKYPSNFPIRSQHTLIIKAPIPERINFTVFWYIQDGDIKKNNLHGAATAELYLDEARANETKFFEDIIRDVREMIGAAVMTLGLQHLWFRMKDNGLLIGFDSEKEQS